MRHRIHGLVLLACLASTTILACGGDDDTTDAGGKGGTSSAGKGGASAGTSGSAGAALAGSSGQNGSGTGGTGGTSAGGTSAGGTSAGGTSAGGASGTGGGGTGGGGAAAGTSAGGALTAGAAGAGTAGTSGSGAGKAGASASGAAGTSAGGTVAGGAAGASAGSGGSGQGGSANACKAPDVLIVLDRTLTMSSDPDGQKPTDAPAYASSKWSQAIEAIEQMVSPPVDVTIRFGLELWPRDPQNGTCVTLAEQVTGAKGASNPSCEVGEVVVPVGTSVGQAIQDYLDPATTHICQSTPTGTALQTAGDYLAKNAEEGREQYIVLVTDGADWDKTCPDPAPLPIVQELADKGIKTFVVGFSTTLTTGGGVGKEFLNDMACAGQTAKGFPGTCQKKPAGYVALDPKSASPIYLEAGNGGQLASSLHSVAGSLCCDCEKSCEPPDMLFVLDRTQSMHNTPGGALPTDAPAYQSSKWFQAITGIEKIVAAPRDQYFRFGLEVWPRDPQNGTCVTLAERVAGKGATNPSCEAGEIPVDTGLNQGQAIQGYLDPATTHLCNTTPTGTALATAATYLTQHYAVGREQYAVLVTDGADWATAGCPKPDPLVITQQLAASGIKTFVVGFTSDPDGSGGGLGVGRTFLNDMACGGQTALGFPDTCKLTDGGYVAVDNNGPRLYLAADNSDELASVLNEATDALGCKP